MNFNLGGNIIMQMKDVKKYMLSAMATIMLCSIFYNAPAEASEIPTERIILSQSIGTSGVFIDDPDAEEEDSIENETATTEASSINNTQTDNKSAFVETEPDKETSPAIEKELEDFNPSISDTDKGFDKNDLDGASSLSKSAHSIFDSLLEAGGLAIFLTILCVLAYFFHFKHRNLVDRDLYSRSDEDEDIDEV